MLSDLMITTILRGIPEALIHIFAVYAYSGKKIDRRRYILSSAILACLLILISMLPISFGIHSILVVMVIIGLAVGINQVSTSMGITSAIINMIIQFIAEGLNIALIQNVLNVDMVEVMAVPLTKAIYGIPSLVGFFVAVFCAYKLNNKHRS